MIEGRGGMNLEYGKFTTPRLNCPPLTAGGCLNDHQMIMHGRMSTREVPRPLYIRLPAPRGVPGGYAGDGGRKETGMRLRRPRSGTGEGVPATAVAPLAAQARCLTAFPYYMSREEVLAAVEAALAGHDEPSSSGPGRPWTRDGCPRCGARNGPP